MFSSALIQAQALATHVGGPMEGGFPWLFIFVPIFWIAFFVVLAIFVRRGARRRFAEGGGWGPHRGPSAESTLANRFANGDIDEQEYRARLEVLRADRPQR